MGVWSISNIQEFFGQTGVVNMQDYSIQPSGFWELYWHALAINSVISFLILMIHVVTDREDEVEYGDMLTAFGLAVTPIANFIAIPINIFALIVTLVKVCGGSVAESYLKKRAFFRREKARVRERRRIYDQMVDNWHERIKDENRREKPMKSLYDPQPTPLTSSTTIKIPPHRYGEHMMTAGNSLTIESMEELDHIINYLVVFRQNQTGLFDESPSHLQIAYEDDHL